MSDSDVLANANIRATMHMIFDLASKPQTLENLHALLELLTSKDVVTARAAGAGLGRLVKNEIIADRDDLLLELARSLNVIREATDKDITLPEGGKVFVVTTLVDWLNPWVEYIREMCPQTVNDCSIFMVAEQYLSVLTGTTLERTYLVWYGEGKYGNEEKITRWFAKNPAFETSHGRMPLAIIGSTPMIIPQLKKLGFPYSDVGIIAPMPCTLDKVRGFPGAWRRSDGDRKADVYEAAFVWYARDLWAVRRRSSAA